VNHKKNTPLHVTVQYGFNALGDFLVDKGANRDARNDEGKTPYEGL
jgi:ankyrin repeat protein